MSGRGAEDEGRGVSAAADILGIAEWMRDTSDDDRGQAYEDIAEALKRTESVIRGLMEVAEMAMPDTYFATDSRVNAARNWLGEEPLQAEMDALADDWE